MSFVGSGTLERDGLLVGEQVLRRILDGDSRTLPWRGSE